ncbi:MAG TPA: alpha/beta hydrolase family protein [Tepidisphaeraceae bacterium]|nr:alpha/beta hydrolase family protein [Tepidisphaeraceae bacterium]
MPGLLIGCLCVGFCHPAIGLAVEPDSARVFDKSQSAAAQARQFSHDVDHPWLFEPHFTDKAQWKKRAADLREQILVSEGLWPLPEKTEMHAVIHGKIGRDGYTIEKVFFASLPGHYVSGSLYRPIGKSGKLPAVLSPHGHWPGGRFYETSEKEAREQIAMGAEKTMAGAQYPLQARCAMLARMGCVVFQYDMVGYADSQAIEHRKGFNDVDATLRLQSFMGLQTWNSIRSLDFLCALPEVDAKRIAVTGASGGGTQTMILCAIDDRPAVSFPAVMVSEAMQGGCICENSPLLRVHTNNAEFAACFAPKPLGMTSANDWTRDIETLGFPQIWSIYKLFSAQDNVAAWHRSFPHNYNQVSRELMYNWVNKHLKLGLTEPVTEKPFEPVKPSELSVYDEAHPRPADTLDAAGLRKEMSAASDAQMAALAKDLAQYRHIVRAALRVMINDMLPASKDVFVGDSRGPVALDNMAIEKGTIRRRDRLARVPYLALKPRQWNGSVVVWIHPDGKASLLGADGKPTADIKKLLDEKIAVIAPDVLLTGELLAPADAKPASTDQYAGFTYSGYQYGYNPSVLASRASDILSTIALARGWEGAKGIDLVAFGKTGPAALLARALAGNAVRRASIDLANFDFGQVRSDTDPMMLPGALKYGGVFGFAALCDTGSTQLWNLPATGNRELAKQTPGVVPHEGNASKQQVLQAAIDGKP